MSKLFKLKKWLTVEEAAQRLSVSLGEEVTPADVFKLALEFHIKISISFFGSVYALPGVTREFTAEDLPRKPSTRIHDGALLGHEIVLMSYKDLEILEFTGPPTLLRGVFDLHMVVGGGRGLVESEYHSLTGTPSARASSIDGLCVLDDNNGIFEVQAVAPHHSEKPQNDFPPVTEMPKGCAFAIRTSELMLFESALIEDDQPAVDIGPTERDNLLKMLGGMTLLLAEKGGKYKRGEKPNASGIAEAIAEIIDRLPSANAYGLSARNIREKLPEAIRLLTDS